MTGRPDDRVPARLADARGDAVDQRRQLVIVVDMGVEIALLTRNIIIESEYVEGAAAGHDGGYLQVLHTPGVAQVVEGVVFVRMGQKDV